MTDPAACLYAGSRQIASFVAVVDNTASSLFGDQIPQVRPPAPEAEIRQIPVLEVTSERIKRPVSVTFYIYGEARAVFAPDLPTSKSRVALAIVGGIAAILAIFGLFFVTVMSQQQKEPPPAPAIETATPVTAKHAAVRHKRSKKKKTAPVGEDEAVKEDETVTEHPAGTDRDAASNAP
jgi:hypothetical protein